MKQDTQINGVMLGIRRLLINMMYVRVGGLEVVGKVLVDPTSVCAECELMVGCVSADSTLVRVECK